MSATPSPSPGSHAAPAALRAAGRGPRRPSRARARGRARLLSALASLIVLGAASARAEEASALVRAQDAFDEGLRRLQLGDRERACERFQASVSIAPSPHGWLQVGTCRGAADPRAALAAFEAALSEARAVADPRRREAYEAAARERIDRLERRVPRVTFRASPTAGARVEIAPVGGGRAARVERFEEPVRLNPGAYHVHVEAPAAGAIELWLDLAEGERREVVLPALPPVGPSPTAVPAPAAAESASPHGSSSAPLIRAASPIEPPPVEPPPSEASRAMGSSRASVWPIVLLGGGVTLGVAGIIAGQRALAARDELVADCAPGAGGRRVCPSDSADDKSRMRLFAVAADVLVATGVLAAGAGVALLVLGGEPTPPAALAAGCFQGGCGLHAAGRF